jgi:hypothetical protein
MFAKRKPKPKGKVAGRIKALSDEAAAKGEKKYQSDLKTAEATRSASQKFQKLPENAKNQQPLTQGDRQQTYAAGRKRAAVNGPDPVKDIQTKKSSGMYAGSVPVAGTSSKSLMRRRNPVRGIRKSDAKASVKKSMIRQMKG